MATIQSSTRHFDRREIPQDPEDEKVKVTDITCHLLKTGRLLLRIYTDEGIVGIAEAGGANTGVMQAYIDDAIRPALECKDPRHVERHWEALVLGAGDPATRVPPVIAGPIDIALWDITGKAAGRPVHELMGGAARKSIPMYWSSGNGWSKTPEEMLERVKEGWDQGFRAFKIRMDWKAYRQDADPEKDFQIFKLCREFLPPEIPLGFDANNGYSVSTAITQGRRFEDLGIAHFEEPLPQYDLPGLKQVVDALDVAVSTGEQEQTRWRFRDLIDLADPDILQPDIIIAGGLSEVKKVFDLAVVHNKPVMPHSPTAGVNSMASLHAYSTVTNGIRPHEYSNEFTGDPQQVQELFNEPVLPVNGVMHLTDAPGFGLTLNEPALEKAIVS